MPTTAEDRRHNVSLPEPKQYNPDISLRVNWAIMRGMDLQPQNRPQSIEEWLYLLENDVEEDYSNYNVVPPTEISQPPPTQLASYK